jgi:hypothetical protein
MHDEALALEQPKASLGSVAMLCATVSQSLHTESELALLRVRAVRTNILEQMLRTAEQGGARGGQANAVPPSGVIGGAAYLDQLRRLERYERRAFSRRQTAIQKLLDVRIWIPKQLRVEFIK